MLILVKPSWSPLLSKVSYSKLTELGQTNGLSLEPAAFGQRESQVCFCFLN